MCDITDSYEELNAEVVVDFSHGNSKVKVSHAKEPYKRDDILQKRPII